MKEVLSVVPLEAFEVLLRFTDHTEKQINLEPYLRGPIFESIRQNPAIFRSIKVDPELGTVVWENGADIDPDVLYYGRTPAWMDELALAP